MGKAWGLVCCRISPLSFGAQFCLVCEGVLGLPSGLLWQFPWAPSGEGNVSPTHRCATLGRPPVGLNEWVPPGLTPPSAVTSCTFLSVHLSVCKERFKGELGSRYFLTARGGKETVCVCKFLKTVKPPANFSSCPCANRIIVSMLLECCALRSLQVPTPVGRALFPFCSGGH